MLGSRQSPRTTDLRITMRDVPPRIWSSDFQPMDSNRMFSSLFFWFLSMDSILMPISDVLMLSGHIPVHVNTHGNMHLVNTNTDLLICFVVKRALQRQWLLRNRQKSAKFINIPSPPNGDTHGTGNIDHCWQHNGRNETSILVGNSWQVLFSVLQPYLSFLQ